MSANKRKMSKEFEEMLEILKSAPMSGDAPFGAFIDRDGDQWEQVGFNGSARHTRARSQE
jgi:hypothetical protein